MTSKFENAAESDGPLASELGESLSDHLRTVEGRNEVLRDFALRVMPPAVDPTLWIRWLNGGEAPLSSTRNMVSPVGQGMHIRRSLERQSKVVQTAAAQVKKAKLDFDSAQRAADEAARKLADCEAKLEHVQVRDAVFIEHLVTKHLMDSVSPVFAMGPAWTLMRAASAHVDLDALAEEMVLITDPKKRDAHISKVVHEREVSSQVIMTTLDQWAGDYDFELAVHEALHALSVRYSRVQSPPAKARPIAVIKKSSPQGAALKDKEAVLAGLRPSA